MLRPVPEGLLQRVLSAEGGFIYEDAPGDRGGPTKGGVDIRSLIAYRGHDCTADDVKNLTMDEWTSIATEMYWHKPKYDELPDCISDHTASEIFDIGWVSGTGTAIKLLQRIVGSEADGVLGPNTFTACDKYVSQYGDSALCNALVDARIRFFRDIVENDPSQEKWLHGWINRAETYRVKIENPISENPVAMDSSTKVIKPIPLKTLKTTRNHLVTALCSVASTATVMQPQLQGAHDHLVEIAAHHPIVQHALVGITGTLAACSVAIGIGSVVNNKRSADK